jgi:hypothetical protein
MTELVGQATDEPARTVVPTRSRSRSACADLGVSPMQMGIHASFSVVAAAKVESAAPLLAITSSQTSHPSRLVRVLAFHPKRGYAMTPG